MLNTLNMLHTRTTRTMLHALTIATSAYHDTPAYRTSCPHRCAAAVRMQSEASEAAAAPARAAQAVAEAEALSLQADLQPPRMAQ